ncbi:MAG: RtcB family protein [Candidatus Lokiarchaeota archaeon]|nr:RtcB family protein [Candidatus Lokiarchaeota archaeon]
MSYRKRPERRNSGYGEKSGHPFTGPLNKITDNIYEIPETFRPGMRVPCRIYSDDDLIQKMKLDNTLIQASNVTFLPGIYKWGCTLPDGHSGYGFPIGGVAAFDLEEGVISPGGVGYDINCGVRVLRTNLFKKEFTQVKELVNELFKLVPSGVGSKGRLKLTMNELNQAIENGSKWAVENGYGWEDDVKKTENEGCLQDANADIVSNRAKERGIPQLGSLGSGNHFLEIQYVEKIYNIEHAKKLGVLDEGQVMIMIHTGSRGFGHQVCSDFLREMEQSVRKYDITIPDRQLACAPINSKEGQNYIEGMSAAANFAWCNRQMIMHWTRQAFENVLNRPAEDFEMNLIYDVAHNIAKFEKHIINDEGKKAEVCVHRKGATRALPAGHELLGENYKSIGQPVLLPGSMGTASYILLGGKKALELSFGSTAHGSGRILSRAEAKRRYWGETVKKDLENEGTFVKSRTPVVLSEEAPGAYKDIDEVAEVSDRLNIATKVLRLRPIGVTKG